MRCTIIENYFCEGDGPYVKIADPQDIDKAYEKGFECMGHPTEIMKKISQDEYNVLVKGEGYKMKLLFKQRMFSWLDSYDIYDENGNTLFEVKGELSWGHCLKIYNAHGQEVGMLQEKVLTFLPKFEMYQGNKCVGTISKEFTLFMSAFDIDYNGWHVEGDFFEWDYQIQNSAGNCIATVTKELWNWTDTYTITVENPEDALCALMVVLAIDAEKCSRN